MTKLVMHIQAAIFYFCLTLLVRNPVKTLRQISNLSKTLVRIGHSMLSDIFNQYLIDHR